MPNVLAPNGFQQFGRQDGGSPTAGLTTRKIFAASANFATPIGRGDPVVTDGATGGIVMAPAGAAPAQGLAGVFYSCEYVSAAVGKLVFSPFWPGGDNTIVPGTDVIAHIVDDSDQLFVAQVVGGPATDAHVGSGANLADVNAPNVFTGDSTNGVALDGAALASAGFRVVGLLTDYVSPSEQAIDDSAPNNFVVVAPNNWARKQLAGVA
ncbi:hypothetical protein [Bradyrhizobium cenepequi]|uniref:hypothetical protein n=1 Tax=Bradyrhizobium cenepequi TaxID=2821403 RepID=UPI001CE2819A|nr:hypothetical protein [Bradyrhizobium cenepequi]MCA6108107.1 hypothetical protein [Bradyrhizobium cenepequi]